MARSSAMLIFGMVTTLFWAGDANPSLWSSDIEAVLSSELADALSGVADSKLAQLEEVLRPMFNTLPKNEHGNLGSAVVRYALHRLFVKKHGWFVRGLEVADAGQNASSPTAILKDLLPSHIEALFEQLLAGRGYGLRQLAILAATLEHLVHDEAMGKLQASYRAHSLLPTDRVTEDDAKKIIRKYMASFTGSGWHDTKIWLEDMQLSVRYADRGVSNPFVQGDLSFARLAHVVEEIDDRYALHQDLECQVFKERLMDREHQLPGRVLLSDFYKKGLNGQFTESVEYLRELGALDESDPKMPPSVVVPNYINAKTNCLGKGKSSFYLICCIDECEGLMGHLEREIATPTAEPQQIAALVSSMPSDTMDAHRNLSQALLSRLDAIAERHAGKVPLHGRLFAQWMHHAYPNECQFPQTAAETNAHAAPRSLSRKDMHNYAQKSDEVDELLVDNYDLPWMDVENLLEDYKQVPLRAAESGVWNFLRNLSLLLAFVGMVVSMAKMSKSTLASLETDKREEYSV